MDSDQFGNFDLCDCSTRAKRKIARAGTTNSVQSQVARGRTKIEMRYVSQKF